MTHPPNRSGLSEADLASLIAGLAAKIAGKRGNNLTATALARHCRVSPATASLWLRGLRSPRPADVRPMREWLEK